MSARPGERTSAAARPSQVSPGHATTARPTTVTVGRGSAAGGPSRSGPARYKAFFYGIAIVFIILALFSMAEEAGEVVLVIPVFIGSLVVISYALMRYVARGVAISVGGERRGMVVCVRGTSQAVEVTAKNDSLAPTLMTVSVEVVGEGVRQVSAGTQAIVLSGESEEVKAPAPTRHVGVYRVYSSAWVRDMLCLFSRRVFAWGTRLPTGSAGAPGVLDAPEAAGAPGVVGAPGAVGASGVVEPAEPADSAEAADGGTGDILLVVPRIYELDHLTIAGIEDDDTCDSTSPEMPNGDVDYSHVREYRPGDQLKRIHWKLSAKTEDELFTKVYETHVQTELMVVLDPYTGLTDANVVADAFDAQLEAAFSIAYHAMRHGIRVRVVFWSRGYRFRMVETDGMLGLQMLVEVIMRPSPRNGRLAIVGMLAVAAGLVVPEPDDLGEDERNGLGMVAASGLLGPAGGRARDSRAFGPTSLLVVTCGLNSDAARGIASMPELLSAVSIVSVEVPREGPELRKSHDTACRALENLGVSVARISDGSQVGRAIA